MAPRAPRSFARSSHCPSPELNSVQIAASESTPGSETALPSSKATAATNGSPKRADPNLAIAKSVAAKRAADSDTADVELVNIKSHRGGDVGRVEYLRLCIVENTWTCSVPAALRAQQGSSTKTVCRISRSTENAVEPRRPHAARPQLVTKDPDALRILADLWAKSVWPQMCGSERRLPKPRKTGQQKPGVSVS